MRCCCRRLSGTCRPGPAAQGHSAAGAGGPPGLARPPASARPCRSCGIASTRQMASALQGLAAQRGPLGVPPALVWARGGCPAGAPLPAVCSCAPKSGMGWLHKLLQMPGTGSNCGILSRPAPLPAVAGLRRAVCTVLRSGSLSRFERLGAAVEHHACWCWCWCWCSHSQTASSHGRSSVYAMQTPPRQAMAVGRQSTPDLLVSLGQAWLQILEITESLPWPIRNHHGCFNRSAKVLIWKRTFLSVSTDADADMRLIAKISVLYNFLQVGGAMLRRTLVCLGSYNPSDVFCCVA